MPCRDPIPLHVHAAANLRFIRATLESATTVPVPGSAGIVMGGIGLLAAALTNIEALRSQWLAVWLAAALLAVPAGGWIVARQYAGRRLTLLAGPPRRLLLCLLPALFAGAVLTAVHLAAANVQAVPGSWLLLYGCSLIAASSVTTSGVARLGVAFVALGLLALLQPQWGNLALAAGFGGLHLLFGLATGARGSDGP